MTRNDPAALGSLLIEMWRHLNSRRRRQAALLAVLMLASALSEVVSLGAVLPFIGALVAPQQLLRNPTVARLAGFFEITSPERLLLPLTVAFIVAAIVAGVIRLLFVWASTRFSYGVAADFSIEVYRRTLYQPYRTHVTRNSSVMISGIINKVAGSTNVLLNLLTLLGSLFVLIAIVVALLSIDAKVATAAALGFFASYGLISFVSRKRLHRNGERISQEGTQVIKALQEGLNGIRDVLLDDTQPLYCDVYRRADSALRRAQATNSFIASSPRFAMEAIGMVLIALLAFALNRQEGGIGAALPVLGALALGAQRLLPALQQGYTAWASVVGNQAMLADTLELLDQELPAEMKEPPPRPLGLKHAIELDHVRFRYAEQGPWVLDGIDLRIPRGSRIGFVGTTGSGKSTALDIIMGLLVATEGEVRVDGQPLVGPQIRAWQRSIAHVPQNIYLADTSIAENIAFGVRRDQIDTERLRRAARQAQIADFIEASPEGYEAFVGERGIRLSGGQRQRIGIARALYKEASVLVFDEATSALDHVTEQSVMEAVEGLKGDLTILLIAHRLSTVQRCDQIVRLEGGRIIAVGSYRELQAVDPGYWERSSSVA